MSAPLTTRRRAVALGTAAALLAAGSISISGSAVSADADDADDAEQVSIRFTWWGNPDRDAKTIEMIDLFMEEYPHIDVVAEPTVFDGYFDKLAVGFAAGDAPDVMTLGGAYPTEYGGNGQLVDLTALADTVGLDHYEPNTYSAAELEGAVYGLPTGGNALGLFVNLDLIEEAGVDVPDDATWTWADFVDFAGELSAALPDDVYGTDWRIQEVKGPFAAQRSRPLYLPEGGIGVDVETIAALYDMTLELLDNGGMPSAEITTEQVGATFEETLLAQGRAVTMFGYSNQLQFFHETLGADVDMWKFPGETEFEEPGLTVLPSQFFAIYSGSEHPEEAAMLIDWLLNEPEAQKIILSDRGLSFNPEILDEITPLLPEYAQREAAYLERIAAEGGPFMPPPREGQGEVDDMTLRLHDEVLFGSLTPEEAAEEWIAEATAIVPED